VKEFEIVEDKRKILREIKLREKLELKATKLAKGGEVKEKDSDSEDSTSDDSDDEKYVEGVGLVGQEINEMQNSKVTVRNLRIREDTAKYLRNLDQESAYYDPKTRSMRENPHEDKDPTQVPLIIIIDRLRW
jgi:pre-mRNA-processing factor SLU7